MNHLDWNIYGGFAGDENDAPPTGRFHPCQIMARQPNATQKIRFDDRGPFGVGDLLESLGLDKCPGCSRECPRRDIVLWFRLRHRLWTNQRRARRVSLLNIGANRRDGFPYASLGAPIDDDASAFSGESFGNRETDASGGPADKRELAFELEIHGYGC